MSTSPSTKKKKLPWWVKLLGIPLLVMGILVAAWFSWYLYAWSQFNKEVDALKTAGQPVTWADMTPPHVPDEDNALLAYQQAAEMYKSDVQPLLSAIGSKMEADGCPYVSNARVDFTDHPILRSAYADEVQELLLKGDRTYRKCIEALGRNGVYWSLKPTFDLTQDFGDLVMAGYAPLSRYLSLRVIMANEHKDAHQAIQGLNILFDIPDTLSQACPAMIIDLISISTQSVAVHTVEEVSSTLLSPTSATEQAKAQLRSLITRIVNETHVASGHVVALKGETVGFIMITRNGNTHLASDDPPWKRQNGPFGPAYVSYMQHVIKLIQRGVGAASETDFPAFKKRLGTWSSAPVGTQRLLHLLTEAEDIRFFESPQCLRAGEMYFRTLARRRMAAAALAIRLYELDHGKRPETLAKLVPDYLPQVPSDPFDGTGKPIQYLPDAKYPRLYSVGMNGTDEGGQYADDPESPPMRDKFDLPFFLTPDKPRETLY